MNYWYAAAPNEIFCDLDSKRALTRALHVCRRAIQNFRSAPRCELGLLVPAAHRNHRNYLPVKSVFYYPTGRRNHYHLIVVLHHALPSELRALWALWMGSDRLRAVYVFERLRQGFLQIPADAGYVMESARRSIEGRADLLVSKQEYHRPANQECECQGKHKGEKMTRKCPALAFFLHNHASADYFPRNHDRKPRGPARFGFGRITQKQLLEWK